MNAMKLRRIANPAVLKRIGRQLLTRFFAEFERQFLGGPPPPAGEATDPTAWPLPPPELPDPEYFRALAGALMRPEKLPAALNEAPRATNTSEKPSTKATAWSSTRRRAAPLRSVVRSETDMPVMKDT